MNDTFDKTTEQLKEEIEALRVDIKAKAALEKEYEIDPPADTDAEFEIEAEFGKELEAEPKRKKRFPAVLAVIAGVVVLFAAAIVGMCGLVKPTMQIVGDKTITAEVLSEYEDKGAKAEFLFFDISDKIKTDASEVHTDKLGEYTVNYSLSFLGKELKAERKITVVDSVSPEIALEEYTGDKIISSQAFFKEPGFVANDNYDGDLTDKVQIETVEDIEKKTVTFIYTVTDTFGNSATAERTISVFDNIAPVITLNGKNEIYTNNANYVDAGATAKDDLDGDITEAIKVETNFKAATVGSFKYTYTVSDKAGNTTTIKRYVYVRDDLGPNISIKGARNMYIVVGQAYTDAGATAYDTFDGAAAVAAAGSVDSSKEGTYKITYTAKDKKGNTSTAVRTVRVVSAPVKIDGAVNGEGIVSDSTIYLTFDDGPSSAITPRVLDILKQNGVKATFFIVNYSEQDKAIVARAIAEGHTIGIHGMSHNYGTIYSSVDAFVNNITSLQKKLMNDFGYFTDLIRFPGGSSNMVSAHYSAGIMSTLCPLMESMGYHYFDWNVSSGDAAGGYVASGTIAYNVKAGLRQGRGNVVLMHDTNGKGTTADALQSIIDYGYANGYTFAGLSSYSPTAHHGINN